VSARPHRHGHPSHATVVRAALNSDVNAAVLDTQAGLHLSTGRGETDVVALFDVSLVVEALDSFAAGETLLARRSLGAFPRTPGDQTRDKPLFGLCDPSWATCLPSRSRSPRIICDWPLPSHSTHAPTRALAVDGSRGSRATGQPRSPPPLPAVPWAAADPARILCGCVVNYGKKVFWIS
jgi:hypothetical protein